MLCIPTDAVLVDSVVEDDHRGQGVREEFSECHLTFLHPHLLLTKHIQNWQSLRPVHTEEGGDNEVIREGLTH